MCKRCGAEAPAGTVEELFALGWGDGGTLCPTCRSDRNARAAATAGRIASGLAGMYAAQWGPGSRMATVAELPSMTVRSSWAVGPGEVLDSADARRVWAELGDGFYLFTVETTSPGDVSRIHAVVNVADGQVELEEVAESDIEPVRVLARSLLEGAPAAPAEVVVTLDPDVRVDDGLRALAPRRVN